MCFLNAKDTYRLVQVPKINLSKSQQYSYVTMGMCFLNAKDTYRLDLSKRQQYSYVT